LITVEQVLDTSAFETAKILGGLNGLGRKVSTVTVAETPDAANWLRGGEIVCTTAYFISKGLKYQIEWIESLVSNGAVALAIKTGRFLGEVPNSIIEAANRLNFPLIEMSLDITWPSVIESVMNLLMDEQNSILKRAEEIHETLTSLVLENESVQTIANQISLLVGNPIIIEDARLNLIVMGLCDNNMRENSEKLIEDRISQTFRKKVLTTEFYQNVLLNRKREELRLRISAKIRMENITVPIVSNKMVYGFISLVEANKKSSQLDLIALKHGSTALALQFMKQNIHEQTLRTKTAALIDDLVNGRFHTELVNEYQIHNYDWTKPVSVAIAELNRERLEEEYTWDSTTNWLCETIRKHLLKHFEHVIVGNSESVFTILVSIHPSKLSSATTILKDELTNIFNECHKQNAISSFFVGIGSTQNEVQKISICYKEADAARSMAKAFLKKGPVVLYENLGIHRIISMVHDREKLKLFCHDFLANLQTYDLQNKDVLLHTLHVYLYCGCIVQETAKKLFVHPNTVAYRLKKIQNIIKHDLNSWEVRLTYLFALEAADIFNSPIEVIHHENVSTLTK
jgi:purine catabolism regulator